MKRKLDKYPHIHSVWFIFYWELCKACEREFRREPGWSALSGPYVNGHGRIIYVCKECCPTKKDAARVFDQKPPRPPPPPPPPPKK